MPMANDDENSSGNMWKIRLVGVAILIVGILVGYFNYSSEIDVESRFPFRLGLDLTGGSHLIYRADVSLIPETEVRDSMEILRDVIERRVNLFGVSEPLVQVERNSILAVGEREERLIVELPGVTDVEEAIRLIGETPLLEFKLLNSNFTLPENESDPLPDDIFIDTGLTGRFLKNAQLEFGSTGQGALSNEPIVLIEFDSDGADLFAELTRNNVGEILAIFLDGETISLPVIQQEILGGRATISGSFSPDEARDLVQNLNFGALPVPIELLSTQTIGASLGEETVNKGIVAGFVGLGAVALFLILWYRLPGLLSVISLSIYIALMLAIFKLVPVTLTAAGVAGFILSIGMAVDANILIFERIKEELQGGAGIREGTRAGFKRAWLAIRDGNISSILTAIVLFWFGTSIVEGFALVFGVGVLLSMLTAITVSRTLLLSLSSSDNKGILKFLFGTGLKM